MCLLDCLQMFSSSGGQLHGPLPIGASSLLSSPQIINLLLCDHRLQGGQHQDGAAHVPQEDPWLQARQHQVHGLGECLQQTLRQILSFFPDFIKFVVPFWEIHP